MLLFKIYKLYCECLHQEYSKSYKFDFTGILTLIDSFQRNPEENFSVF